MEEDCGLAGQIFSLAACAGWHAFKVSSLSFISAARSDRVPGFALSMLITPCT